MSQMGCNANLAQKPLRAVDRTCVRAEHLHGNEPVVPNVPRSVDFAHPACAQRRNDFIGAQVCAWSEGHSWAEL